jgi:hypothetical protein
MSYPKEFLYKAIHTEITRGNDNLLPLLTDVLQQPNLSEVIKYGVYHFRDDSKVHTALEHVALDEVQDDEDDIHDADDENQDTGVSARAEGGEGRQIDPATTDTLGWTVVHLPTLIQRMVEANAERAVYQHIPRGALHALKDPGLAYSFQLAAREFLMAEVLPPAATVWSSSRSFQTLLQPLAKQPKEAETDWLVFRGTPLSTWNHKTETWAQPLLPKFKTLSGLFACEPIYQTMPSYIRLLFRALCAARTTSQGYRNWGLAWMKDHLYFHHRRALASIKLDPLLKEEFPLEQNTYLEQWESYDYAEEPSVFYKQPRLSMISSPADRQRTYLPYQLAPYDRVREFNVYAPGTYAPEGAKWGSEYARVFPLKSSGVSLITYIARLWEIAADPNIQTQIRPAGRLINKQRSVIPRKTPTRNSSVKDSSPQIIPVHTPIRFTLMNADLGWIDRGDKFADPYYERLRVPIIKDGDYYIAVPDDIANLIPAAAERACYDLAGKFKPNTTIPSYEELRQGVSHRDINALMAAGGVYDVQYTETYSDPFSRQDRQYRYDFRTVTRFKPSRSINRYTSRIVRHATPDEPPKYMTYLHANMYAWPHGEFWQMLEVITNTKDTTGALDPRCDDAVGLLRAFRMFCIWLHAPSEALRNDTDRGSLGHELMFLVNDDPCPVKTPTLQERLAFLHAKAECLDAPDQRDTEKSSGRTGARAPRFSVYDEWVMWYAATHDIPRLKVTFTQGQYEEYMCKRWLTWRRPLGVRGKLPKLKSATDRDGRLIAPVNSTKPPEGELSYIDKVIERAEEFCGPAYTRA